LSPCASPVLWPSRVSEAPRDFQDHQESRETMDQMEHQDHVELRGDEDQTEPRDQ